jgi:hypothetical protein
MNGKFDHLLTSFANLQNTESVHSLQMMNRMQTLEETIREWMYNETNKEPASEKKPVKSLKFTLSGRNKNPKEKPGTILTEEVMDLSKEDAELSHPAKKSKTGEEKK